MAQHLKRTLSAAAVGVIALGASVFTAPAAAADPRGEALTIHCDSSGTFEVIVVGGGKLAPGLVVDSNRVVIPYRISIAGVFTPTVGAPEPFADEFARPAPGNGRLDHCVFHQEGALEDGTFVLDGNIWASYTP
jgi:hypothetical protein